MIGRGATCWSLTAAMLAVGLLAPAPGQAQIGGIVADEKPATGWSPSRDDAELADSSGGASLAQYQNEVLPEGGPVINSRLMSRRPAGLSRPAPGNMLLAADGQSGELISTPDGAEPVPQGMYSEGAYFDEGGNCCNGCCGNWNTCGPAPICCLLPRLDCSSFEVFGGVQGFTGPANRGAGGSFGFHEGFNWGSSLCGCGAFQVGTNWTQSNLDGTFITDETRDQVFVTGGWFRRCDMGLQGGVVVDWLHDEWDYEVDLTQIRAEVSWKCCQDDFGAWVALGINDGESVINTVVDAGENTFRVIDVNAAWEVNDMYAFFWRRQFQCGGEGRAFGGFTANGQGLLGADALVPLNPCWSLRGNFLYLIPNDSNEDVVEDFTEETWNVSLSVVWTPFARPNGCQNYCRPLFNVADNGSFATRIFQ